MFAPLFAALLVAAQGWAQAPSAPATTQARLAVLVRRAAPYLRLDSGAGSVSPSVAGPGLVSAAHWPSGQAPAASPPPPSAPPPGSRPQVPTAKLPPAAPLPAAFARDGVVELYRLRYEEVAANGLSSQVVEREFWIRTRWAAQIFAAYDLGYDSSRWTFHLWKAEVIRADGRRAQATDAGDADPDDPGNRTRRLRLPPLEAGDRIDVIYVLTPIPSPTWSRLDGIYLGDLFAFRDSYALRESKYVLVAPRPLAVSQLRLPPPATSRVGGDYRWIWSETRPLPPFWSDLDGPSITDRAPFVQTAQWRDWSDLVAWYTARLDEQARTTPQFLAELRRLAPRQATPLATTQEIWRYLAAHLRYRGEEAGVHGFVPAPPSAVLRAQAGDCKDGALLLTTWLRAEGIGADLALVRTWPMGAVGDGAATIAAFDHAIVYVPSLNLWIDTTAPDLRVGELPASDQGGLALIVRPGESQLTRVPIAAASQNETRRNLRLEPRDARTWRMSGDIRITGADAADWRLRFQDGWMDPAHRMAAFTDWLRGYFPRARATRVAVQGFGPGMTTVSVVFTAIVPRDEVGRSPMLFRRPYVLEIASEASRRQERHLDLRWRTVEDSQIEEPDCRRWPDSGRTLASAFGALRVQRSCRQGWLRTSVMVTQDATTVPAAAYGAFRGFWQRVDAALAPSLERPATLEAANAPSSVPPRAMRHDRR